MASGTPRRRASTLKTPPAEVAELQVQIDILGRGLRVGHVLTEEELEEKINAGYRIRQTLLDDNVQRRTRDAFRHVGGFQNFLQILKYSADFLRPSPSASRSSKSAFELFQTLFLMLSASLRDHRGNDRFFRFGLGENGWTSVERSLKNIPLAREMNDEASKFETFDLIVGSLLSCALEDDTLLGMPARARRVLARYDSVPSVQEPVHSSPYQNQEVGKLQGVQRSTDPLSAFLEKETDPDAILHHPEPILVVLALVWDLADNTTSPTPGIISTIRTVLRMVMHIAQASTANLNSLHEAGALGKILPVLAKPHACSLPVQNHLFDLSLSLLQLGISSLDDAFLMYHYARSSPLMADLVLAALKTSRTPSFVHFDLSRHGFASIELPGIGRAFPPQGPHAGYTFSIWFQIIHFDVNSHTTLFGAFDPSQTCFVLLYIEKDTRNMILQTSVTSSKPSVRFKSTSFAERQWYHVVITHQRPKVTSSARASLFINGEFVEQVKAQYPASIPPLGKKESQADSSPSSKQNNAIQAFLGTPQDLATRLGKGLVLTKWRLASSHLFSDVLNDDLIAVHYHLGSRYTGNFQDCLGSFQTYKASAALNLRNESLHPGKEDRSDIITAIRSKAGLLLPESLVILNISASVVLDDNDNNNINETRLIKNLSKNASKNLWSVTRGGRNALAINGAIPSVNDALLYSSGFAILTGDPCAVVPGSLDDAAWRVAGCAPVGLAILEAADTPRDVLRSLEITFESIQENWRNSEAMERDNGFGALAILLTSKLDSRLQDSAATPPGSASAMSPLSHERGNPDLDLQVLNMILEFVGYRHDKPEESVINNPLAYRILLVDLDWWRTRSSIVLEKYYGQFTIFASQSKYRHFNLKRLLKMRVLKKWLESLKTEVFEGEGFEFFMSAFEVILKCGINAEAMRSLSLYITYAIHKRNYKQLQPARARSVNSRSGTPIRKRPTNDLSHSPAGNRETKGQGMSQMQIAAKIMVIYTDLLCREQDTSSLQKFARTVTNKWLLHLLADSDPMIIISAVKILVRLLIINGPTYMGKFVEKTGGISILRHRLREWWYIPEVWYSCFALFFGIDVAKVDFSRAFSLFNLLDAFGISDETSVVYPQMLQVLTSMLQSGLKNVTDDKFAPYQPSTSKGHSEGAGTCNNPFVEGPPIQAFGLRQLDKLPKPKDRLDGSPSILRTVLRFLTDVHSRSQGFRDFAINSSYVQDMFAVLFPSVTATEPLSALTELHYRDHDQGIQRKCLIIKPLSNITSVTHHPTPVTTSIESQNAASFPKHIARRMSSYVLVNPEGVNDTLRNETALSKPANPRIARMSNAQLVHELLELTISVFLDQIFTRKDFPGLGLFMRVPPAYQTEQSFFETYVLRNTILHIRNHIRLNKKVLCEPRVLTNLARFAGHLGEAISEGWFDDGSEIVLELLAETLEHLQLPEISMVKSVRLCNQVIISIKTMLLRIILYRLSEVEQDPDSDSTVAFLEKVVYWQTVLQPMDDSQLELFRLLCFLLYCKLIKSDDRIKDGAANLLRMLIVQEPDGILTLLQVGDVGNQTSLVGGFAKIAEVDNEAFLAWVKDNQMTLEEGLFQKVSSVWAHFAVEENQKILDTAKARVNKRKERLRQWDAEISKYEEIARRYEVTTDHWRSNIFAAEDLKRQRTVQDQVDNQVFNISNWTKMKQGMQRPCGLFDDHVPQKWQLDLTEGRDRMRLRLSPDLKGHSRDYQPKRSQSQVTSRSRRSTAVRGQALTSDIGPHITHESTEDGIESGQRNVTNVNGMVGDGADQEVDEPVKENDFEIVDDPQEDMEYEDKNRKVMRSLQRGDQVEHVHNIARIIGLEAIESLLILGKFHLYLLDNLFQRSDGEVVNSWQAPPEERDSYLQMISGRQADARSINPSKTDHETRCWRWEDVLSISKRRFLLRDVALELFFVDGRSYLLTASKVTIRDELYQKLSGMTQNFTDRSPSSTEDNWRVLLLRNPGDETHNLGSKITNVFSSAATYSATRRWIKGEISNFQYLMIVNTMAGRTFNDLTQYPVFPWVIADYTSDELDLENPKSFRDLSKPMGCQSAERQKEFMDRYESFAEMGDERSQPFHYGTHYSSAMIVTSYLIRIQPFVQSYLLLQGGNFDHADRLFYSVEKAWTSASKINMTDVRELIPEFFYLPDFLCNVNGYDFGSRQGNGGRIDNVHLPPWAKGDPKVFIAKNREALESDYVSRHLHSWIDLIFGCKQKGESALEAINVFHNLSYHGAKDLDNIEDPVERLATIGIIHNFGQTPYQIFQKSHPAREIQKFRAKHLDSAAENLTRLPFPLVEITEKVASLQYSRKFDRVIPTGTFRIDIAPTFDKYMLWGFVDHGLRFFASDTNKLCGLFEHVHQSQLSCAIFADMKTLITAGTDCTITVWTVISTPKTVDLQPLKTLFGHRQAPNVLAVSRSFSALLSASLDGCVLLWDLNRLELVRVLGAGKTVECARINDVTGTIMLCRGSEVSIWTLNGDLILEQDIFVENEDQIFSCAFYEGSGSAYLERNLIFTGQRRGVVNIWNIAIRRGQFVLEHVKSMHHLDQAGFNIGAPVTAILPMLQVVYTGDDEGRVFEWDCIQRQ